MFELIGRLVFSRTQVKKMEKQLSAAGADSTIWSGERSLGLLSIITLIIAVFATMSIYTDISSYQKITGFVGSYILLPDVVLLLLLFMILLFLTVVALWLTTEAMLALYIEARRNALEVVLPDFLTLTAANIKAGMPLDQALWYSAKPEFGLLSIEVKKAIKRAFSGESLDNSLEILVNRFQSKVFTRTISLIKQASAAGGEVAGVLENTAEDTRNMLILKKEVAASLVLYEIFVLFAGIAGTPFLFSVAGKLIEVFEKQRTAFPVGSGGGMPSFFNTLMQTSGNAAAPVVTSSEFYYFAIGTILVTSIFSSLIVSVIRTGTKNEGVKYFPFIFLAAYLVYVVVSSFLASMFVTLI